MVYLLIQCTERVARDGAASFISLCWSTSSGYMFIKMWKFTGGVFKHESGVLVSRSEEGTRGRKIDGKEDGLRACGAARRNSIRNGDARDLLRGGKQFWRIFIFLRYLFKTFFFMLNLWKLRNLIRDIEDEFISIDWIIQFDFCKIFWVNTLIIFLEVYSWCNIK